MYIIEKILYQISTEKIPSSMDIHYLQFIYVDKLNICKYDFNGSAVNHNNDKEF